MKIVFYSSNSNKWDSGSLVLENFPSWTEQWLNVIKAHPENEYFFVSQKPALFMPELENKDINITFLPPQSDAQQFTDFIESLKPDKAIALSFWITPYDWLGVKDSIIGEKLLQKGIDTVCHSVNTSMLCFDKWRTHQELEKHNFNIAKAVYVHHDMYFCAGSHTDVQENVYKETVLFQIQQLRLPLIIKDTLGLSSYGMTVVHTYGEAFCYLNSKRNNSDRIVEEYIEGFAAGTEIHGNNGNYRIFPPFFFNVNQYGITSPKQSIKIGPVTDAYFKIDELNAELMRLAHTLKFNGIAQVDLIFSKTEKKWYIIEINPRLSGMTETYLSSYNKESGNFEYVINQKIPLKRKDELIELKKDKNIRYISQIQNLAAKQEREKGYCEVISSCTKKDVDAFIKKVSSELN